MRQRDPRSNLRVLHHNVFRRGEAIEAVCRRQQTNFTRMIVLLSILLVIAGGALLHRYRHLLSKIAVVLIEETSGPIRETGHGK